MLGAQRLEGGAWPPEAGVVSTARAVADAVELLRTGRADNKALRALSRLSKRLQDDLRAATSEAGQTARKSCASRSWAMTPVVMLPRMPGGKGRTIISGASL